MSVTDIAAPSPRHHIRLIDTRARAANDSPNFSQLIREGLPEAVAFDSSGQ